MADIRKLYIDLMLDIDPYSENDSNIPESLMLYNMIQIYDCLTKNIDLCDKSLINIINRLNTLIDLFTSLGIKPAY